MAESFCADHQTKVRSAVISRPKVIDMLAKRYLLVTSRALPGREKEYADWYKDRHIADVLKVPGFIDGKMYCGVDPDGIETGEFKGLYEICDGEPGALLGELMARRNEMDLSDAIDPASVNFLFLDPA